MVRVEENSGSSQLVGGAGGPRSHTATSSHTSLPSHQYQTRRSSSSRSLRSIDAESNSSSTRADSRRY